MPLLTPFGQCNCSPVLPQSMRYFSSYWSNSVRLPTLKFRSNNVRLLNRLYYIPQIPSHKAFQALLLAVNYRETEVNYRLLHSFGEALANWN